MIFDNLTELKKDLNNKILRFVNANTYDKYYILSIINSYLNELQNLGELEEYSAVISEDDFYDIYIKKRFDIIQFKLNIKNEIRKKKLNNLNKFEYILN